jgi:hypothetical protein
VESAVFYCDKSIVALINKTENLYIKELENGDRQKGMKRLRVPPLTDDKSHWTSFKVNLFIDCYAPGILAAMFLF